MFFRKVDVNLVLSFGIIAATEEKEETFYVKNVDVDFISESEDLRSYNFDGVFDEKIKELILGVSLWCSYKPWCVYWINNNKSLKMYKNFLANPLNTSERFFLNSGKNTGKGIWTNIVYFLYS